MPGNSSITALAVAHQSCLFMLISLSESLTKSICCLAQSIPPSLWPPWELNFFPYNLGFFYLPNHAILRFAMRSEAAKLLKAMRQSCDASSQSNGDTTQKIGH